MSVPGDPAGNIIIEAHVAFQAREAEQRAREIGRTTQEAFQRGFQGAPAAARATEQVNQKMGELGKTVQGTHRHFQTFGGGLQDAEKGLITVAIAAAQVGRNLTRMITRPILSKLREGISATSELTESINLTNVVMGDAADRAVEWADGLDRAFGVTQREALQAASNMTRLFNEMGISMGESINISQELIERVGDIASALDIPVPTVLAKIESGLVGQTRAVRDLGIILDEEVLKREAVERGIVSQGQAMTVQQKIMLRSQLILEQTNELQGDAANTAHTYAGVLRQARVVQDEFSRSLGEILIPILTKMGTIMLSVLERISNLPKGIRTVIVVLGLLAAAIGPLLIIVGLLATSILAVGGAVLVLKATNMGAIFSGVLAPIRAATVAIRTVTVAVGGLNVALGALASAAVLGFVLFRLMQIRSEIKQLQASLREGVDTTTLVGLQEVIANINDELVVQNKRLEENSGFWKRIKTFVTTGRFEYVQTRESVNALNNELGLTAAKVRLAEVAFQSIANRAGAPLERVQEIVSELGLDLEKLSAENVDRFITQVTQALFRQANAAIFARPALADLNDELKEIVSKQEQLISLQKAVERAQQGVVTANERLQSALKGVTDALERVNDANERVIDSHRRLAEAQERLADVTKDLEQLERDRLVLINDTARDVRELAEAEDDLLRIRFRLHDLNEQELDIMEQIRELRTPATAQELARADRDIERAKIALNKALRAQQQLEDELNQSQQESVDLSGLTLDQLRTRLAGIRAQTAAQRRHTRQEESVANAEERQIEARLDVADAQDRHNQALEERNNLENKVVDNAGEIIRLENQLGKLQLDRRTTMRQLGDAQDRMNRLRAGETARALEIEQVDARIVQKKKEQETAARGIEEAVKGIDTATRNVEKATDAVHTAQRSVWSATLGVRNAELEVLDAKREQNFQATLLLGSEREINKAYLDRIDYNNTIGRQEDRLFANREQADHLANIQQQAQSLWAQIPAVMSPAFLAALGGPAGIARMILDNPNRLRDLLRQAGVPFAEGGLITKPTLAQMGENSRPEMVLPLTKPDRVWELLSSTLPRFPGALAAAKSAIDPGGASTAGRELSRAVSLGKKVSRRADGPMTFKQAQEMIQLLRETPRQVHVEAPINVSTPVEDPEFLAKRVSQRVERTVIEKLRR